MKMIALIPVVLMSLFYQSAFSQISDDRLSSHVDLQSLTDSRAVTLVVIDSATGLPVSGATVIIGDTGMKMFTDAEGIALLQLSQGNRNVTVSAQGYQTLTTPIKASNILTANLIPVIETSNYISGYNVTNRVAELMGELYSVTRPGYPGSGSALFIDGIHSINGSSQPLYIVDGQPWQGYSTSNNLYADYSRDPISLLDAENIQSMYVLKDGSAIYGPKGGNGVVVIKTKRATDVPIGLNIKVSTGVRTAPFRHDIPSSYGNLIQPGSNTTDWVGLITHNAFVADAGVNYSGRISRLQYRASMTYNHEDGAIRNTSSNSIKSRINTDFALFSNVTARVDLTFGHRSGNQLPDGLDAHSSPYFMAHMKAPWSTPWNSGGNLSDTDRYGVGNPIAILQLGYGHVKHNQFSALIEPKWKIDSRWTVTGQAGYIFDSDQLNQFIPDLGTPDVVLNSPDGLLSTTMAQTVNQTANRRTTFNADVHAVYTPWHDGDHHLDVKAGGRWRNDTWNIDDHQGFNTGSDIKTSLSDVDPRFTKDKEHYLRWRSLGGYATGNYNWLQRYFLDITGVIEGSSRFGSKAPGAIHVGGVSWGVFPSVAASWLVSEENFFSSINTINRLKLNLSYTVTGNDDLPLTTASTFFTSHGILSGDDIFRLARSTNQQLKWETTATLRGCIDIGIFSDRITSTADIFMANVYNLMLYKTSMSSSSSAGRWVNGGSMRNVGFTFTVASRLINTPGPKLDLSIMAGGYRNRVTSLTDGSFVTDLSGAQVLTAVGYPVGTFYGVKRPDESKLYAIGNPNPDAYGNVKAMLKWGRFSVCALFTWTAGNDIYNGLRAAVDRQYSDWYLPDSPQSTTSPVFNESMIESGSFLKLKRVNIDYKIPLKTRFFREMIVNFTTANLFTLTGYRGADPEIFGGSTPLSLGIDNGLLPACRSFQVGVNITL